MAKNYLKPQEPLFKENKETGDIDYFYPLVTDDQIILEDGRRLNAFIAGYEEAVSPTVSVSKSGTVTTVSITDKEGTKTAKINDGAKGDPFTYEDFTAEQLKSLKGEKGDDGYTPQKNIDYFDGKDGTSMTHTWDGTILTLTSASGTSSSNLKGDKGERGYTPQKNVDYFDGKDGAAGKDGISATHSWNGTTLTITSASGTSSANLKGEKGDTGKDGTSVNIKGSVSTSADLGALANLSAGDGYITEDNGHLFVYNGITFTDVGEIRGPQGLKGEDGQDGVSATHRWDGTTLYITTASGTSSANLKGEKGDDGYTPVKGKDYSDGAAGKDGISPTVSVSKSGKITTLSITDANGTQTTIINDGQDGDKGDPYILNSTDKAEIVEDVVDEIKTIGYITSEDIPDSLPASDVYDWAKQPNKPTYTKSDVGLGNVDNVKQYSVSNPPPYPVTSINGQTGAVEVEPKGTAAQATSQHNTNEEAHNDIRLILSNLTTKVNDLLDSDDNTLDQMSEVVAYIKANRELLESVTTNKVNVTDIIDNLTTSVSNKPLSAKQGVQLKALIDAIKVPTKLSELGDDSTHRLVTDTEKATWNAKSNFSGNYNDLSNKPTIPTVPTNISAFNNDAGYMKSSEQQSVINTALAQAKSSGEFDGENGLPGTAGKDGISPTVTVSKSGKVTTVKITDVNGTKTATINDGVDGKDGEDGDDGQRGFSILKVATGPSSYTTETGGFTPTHRITLSTVKTEAKVTEVLVGDTLAYNYYQFLIGHIDDSYAYLGSRISVRGSTGAAGKDGTSVTVSNVTESTADGGSNVVTFSDGKTVTIKNGSKGSTGSAGKDGANGSDGVGIKSVVQTTTSSADGGSNIITVTKTDGTTSTFTVKNGSKGSTGATGAAGKTPEKGTDYFTEADKAEMVADVIETMSTNIEPMADDIPKVFLTGEEFSNMTADKNEVNMELEYRSKTKQFKSFIKIKFQGRSSLSKPKKNFTIKMYTDEARESKNKMAFKDWGHKTHKYVLKANFIDHTHARNIIGANLWSEVVASRTYYYTLPEELKNSPRNGAVDGFPIKLYVNGTYQGLYTWNIGKDDWMWGLDEDNPNHFLLANEGDQGSSVINSGNFRKIWNGVDGSHWSVEVGTNSDALKTSLNNLITFVMETDTENAFNFGINNYLDLESAIDYYIHSYVICNIDSLALNMLLATYDGQKWICGAYDMDSTFGLWWTGEKFVSTDYKCPEDYQDKFSLLWERLEEFCWSKIQTRYAELRKTVYTPSNMFTHFERFMDIIGLDLYAEDLDAYPTIPSGDTNNIKQLRNFIRDRLAYCDSQITNGIPAIGVNLNETEWNIPLGTPVTLTATKSPSNATDDVYWYSTDTSIATVKDGVVTPVAVGSCVIYARCGSGYHGCEITVRSATVEPDEPQVSYTNLVPTSIDTNGSVYNGVGYMNGKRLSSSGGVSGSAEANATHTGFIKFKKGDYIRIKIIGGFTGSGSGNYFNFYNTSFSLVSAEYPDSFKNGTYGRTETLADGSTLITIFTNTNSSLTANTEYYIRVSLNPAKGENLIITVNQEITD